MSIAARARVLYDMLLDEYVLDLMGSKGCGPRARRNTMQEEPGE